MGLMSLLDGSALAEAESKMAYNDAVDRQNLEIEAWRQKAAIKEAMDQSRFSQIRGVLGDSGGPSFQQPFSPLPGGGTTGPLKPGGATVDIPGTGINSDNPQEAVLAWTQAAALNGDLKGLSELAYKHTNPTYQMMSQTGAGGNTRGLVFNPVTGKMGVGVDYQAVPQDAFNQAIQLKSTGTPADPNYRFRPQSGLGQTGGGMLSPEDVGLTPEALDMAAETYIRTGQAPPMGNSKLAGAARIMITNRAAEILNANNMTTGDMVSLTADTKSNSKALAQVAKTAEMVNAYEKTADANFKQVEELSSKYQRDWPTFVNRVKVAVDKGVGDKDALALANVLKTTANEYAKVITGQTTGVAVSDAARKETESLLNAAYSDEVLKNLLVQYRREMQNRVQSFDTVRTSLRGGLSAPLNGGTTKPPDNFSTTGIDLNAIRAEKARRAARGGM